MAERPTIYLDGMPLVPAEVDIDQGDRPVYNIAGLAGFASGLTTLTLRGLPVAGDDTFNVIRELVERDEDAASIKLSVGDDEYVGFIASHRLDSVESGGRQSFTFRGREVPKPWPMPKRARLAEVQAIVDERPCATCRGARFTGYGSGYGDVCDGCAGAGTDPLYYPQEAWEAFATHGFIGAEDVESPRRLFACAECDGRTYVHRVNATGDGPSGPYDCDACKRDGVIVGEFPHPPTLAFCVAMAADWPGVLAAEQIARSFGGDKRIVWRVGERREWFEAPYGPGLFSRHRQHAELRALGYAIDSVTEDCIVMVCPPPDGE